MAVARHAAVVQMALSRDGEPAEAQPDFNEMFELAGTGGTDSEDGESDGSTAADGQSALRRLVFSDSFSIFFALLILLNVIAMMLQADYPKLKLPQGCHGHECVSVWGYVNMTFLVLFVIELTLRLVTHGCADFFWRSHDWAWNAFDFFIVAIGVLDFMARVMNLGHRGGKFMQIVRILRILRVLRVLRLLRTFKRLRMLARGLVESVTVVFWIFFLIVFLIYIFAIFFTTIIGRDAALWGDEEPDIKLYFGSVARSMFTLFQFLTLDNWNDVDGLIIKKMPLMQFWIFLYVIIASFVILSLLTGVMADHMDEVRKDEDEETAKQNRAHMGRTLNLFKTHFNREEDSADAAFFITKKEFGSIFASRSLTLDFQVDDLQLSGTEALELFEVFDRDGDGLLTLQEFVKGLEEYREGLSTKQLLLLKATFKTLLGEVERNGGRPPASERREAAGVGASEAAALEGSAGGACAHGGEAAAPRRATHQVRVQGQGPDCRLQGVDEELPQALPEAVARPRRPPLALRARLPAVPAPCGPE